MPPNGFTLSIEELAYAMGVLGGAEIASGYLRALLGERPQLELEGRLFAASHALVARKLLDFNPQTGDKQLSPEFTSSLRALIQHDYSLRCTRVVAVAEDILNFYRSGTAWLEHRISKAVVADITLLEGPDAITRQSAAFFDFPCTHSAAQPAKGIRPAGVIPAALIEPRSRSDNQSSTAQMVQSLVSAGLSPENAKALATDLASPAIRGSIMKVEIRTDGLAADRGILLFKGSNGAWILEIVPQDPPMLRVFIGDFDQLQRSIEALFT